MIETLSITEVVIMGTDQRPQQEEVVSAEVHQNQMEIDQSEPGAPPQESPREVVVGLVASENKGPVLSFSSPDSSGSSFSGFSVGTISNLTPAPKVKGNVAATVAGGFKVRSLSSGGDGAKASASGKALKEGDKGAKKMASMTMKTKSRGQILETIQEVPFESETVPLTNPPPHQPTPTPPALDPRMVQDMVAKAIKECAPQIVAQVAKQSINQNPTEQPIPSQVEWNRFGNYLTNRIDNFIDHSSSTSAELQRNLDARLGAMETRLLSQEFPAAMMPSSENLPEGDPQNPWRSGIAIPVINNMLFIDGLGNRPISDFEIFPPGAKYPYCFLRLSPNASIRQDRVPKESVIYPTARAQNAVVNIYEIVGAVNTRSIPSRGNYVMFAAEATPIPFLSKVLESVTEALNDNKPCPSLKEADYTSLVFPGEAGAWKGVTATFTSGRLAANCASVQFNEDFPKLTDALIKNEFETRSRLMRTLHLLTLTEVMRQENSEVEHFSILAKAQINSAAHDLYDFGLARRACRKYVLHFAKLRHEPTKLIMSSLWGESLFPGELVSEMVEAAAHAGQSLHTRWDIPVMRRPNTFGKSKARNKWRSFRVTPYPEQTQFKNYAGQSMPSTSRAPVQAGPFTGPSQPVVLFPPYPSPVTNQTYERQTFQGQRYVRGRGGRGRGQRGRISASSYRSFKAFRGNQKRGGRGGRGGTQK